MEHKANVDLLYEFTDLKKPVIKAKVMYPFSVTVCLYCKMLTSIYTASSFSTFILHFCWESSSSIRKIYA